jgi:hypothetical protein
MQKEFETKIFKRLNADVKIYQSNFISRGFLVGCIASYFRFATGLFYDVLTFAVFSRLARSRMISLFEFQCIPVLCLGFSF